MCRCRSDLAGSSYYPLSGHEIIIHQFHKADLVSKVNLLLYMRMDISFEYWAFYFMGRMMDADTGGIPDLHDLIHNY